MEKFTFSIVLSTFHLSSSAKLKTRFSVKENLKKCTSFEDQKGYIRGNVYFYIIIFCSHSSSKPCLQVFLLCFAREIKGFYQISWRNELDLMDMMYVSPKISVQDGIIQKKYGRIDFWRSQNDCTWGLRGSGGDAPVKAWMQVPDQIFFLRIKHAKTVNVRVNIG